MRLLVACAIAMTGCSARSEAPVAARDDEPPRRDPDDRSTWTAEDYLASAEKRETIVCPDGTTRVGDSPPKDDFAYCVLPDGRFHGPWMVWPYNGHNRKFLLHEQGHGVLWIAWYRQTDTVDVIMEMRADKLHGRTLRWHDNGQLAFDGRYVDDHPQGWCRAWDRDGALIFDEDLEARGGRLITWSDGMRVEETWRDGKRDGPVTRWYANGQVESIVQWTAGEQGAKEEWLPDGSPKPEEPEEPEWLHD